MTPHDLIAAFDVLADAPDGVKRLRELVLSLAFRGRLFPDTDIDWPWQPLSDLAESLQNGTSSRGGEGGLPVVVLRLADIKRGRVVDDGFRLIDLSAASAKKYRVESDDVLVIRVNGSGDLVGRFVHVERGGNWCYCDHLIRIRLRTGMILPRFLCLYGETPVARSHLSQVTVTTAGQKTINQKGLGSLAVPIPPLAEQHRIVARVDELMGLLDRLEAARATRDAVRRAARDAALAELRDAPDADAVETAWSRISRHMDDFFTEPEDVPPLRQAILQLAVRGRLVPQDPTDEPASKLLARSRAERHQAGRTSTTTPCDIEPWPLLPSGWVWARMDDLLLDIEAGWSPSAQGRPKEEAEWGVLKVSACSWGRFLPDQNKALNPDTVPRENLEVRPGDLLISRANTLELVARSVVVHNTPPRLMLSDKTLRLWPTKSVDVNYLNLANLSDLARAHYRANATGTSDSMRNVSQGAIRNTPIPLPPRREQSLIVGKVNDLNRLCDIIEGRLTSARDFHDRFASAAIHHLDV